MSGAVLKGPGRIAPRLAATSAESDRHRQATSSSLKFSGVIWSSGEYLVFAGSAPNARHSPTGAGDCARAGAADAAIIPASAIAPAAPPAQHALHVISPVR